jgi:hypothetical protein
MHAARLGDLHPWEVEGLRVEADRRRAWLRSWVRDQARFLDVAADDVVIDLRQGSVSVTS